MRQGCFDAERGSSAAARKVIQQPRCWRAVRCSALFGLGAEARKTMHEKLIELARRLLAEGRSDDAVLVFSAAAATAPLPTPKHQSLSQPVPGYFLATTGY